MRIEKIVPAGVTACLLAAAAPAAAGAPATDVVRQRLSRGSATTC